LRRCAGFCGGGGGVRVYGSGVGVVCKPCWANAPNSCMSRQQPMLTQQQLIGQVLPLELTER
jgi:hypothetical protein